MELNPIKNGPVSAGPFFSIAAQLVSGLMALTLVSLVFLVGGEVILRSIAGKSLGFVEEVTGYLVVALTLFGAALAVRSNSLFRVSFIFTVFPAGFKKVLWFVFITSAIAVCIILAWKSYQLVGSSFSRGKFAPTVLRTPLWIPQLVMPIGFFTLALFLVEQFLLSLRSIAGDK